jgi:hypothetical protein
VQSNFALSLDGFQPDSLYLLKYVFLDENPAWQNLFHP